MKRLNNSKSDTFRTLCFAFVLCASAVLLNASPVAAWCQTVPDPETETDPETGEEVPIVDEDGCFVGEPKLHWPKRCASYAVDGSGGKDISPEVFRLSANRAFSHWLDVDCPLEGGGTAELDFDIQVYTEPAICNKAQFKKKGSNVNTIAFVSDWDERNQEIFDPNAIAVTVTWFTEDTGEILDVDILINDTMGPFAQCADMGCSGPPFPIDLESILTHEAGHFFGISHSLAPGATMIASYNAAIHGILPRTLTGDDIEAICTIYEGAAENPSCDPTPKGGLDLDCTSSKSGCSMHPLHNDGKVDLFWLVVLLGLARRRRRYA